MSFLQFSKNKKIKGIDVLPAEENNVEEECQEPSNPPAENQQNLLAHTLEAAPAIRGLLGTEVGLYISDLERYLYVNPGKVKLSLNAGDAIRDGSVAQRTIRSAARATAKVGKEIYGLPYIGTGYPIIDPVSHKVIGSIATTTPVELQESLNDIALHLESQINTIITAVTTFSATSQELTATMENLNSNAQSIREEIKKTDGIATMIQDISGQTHMLGLNAAIEAARVGDAGRGFNVVAEEIRKLSQDTSRSAKDILQLLEEMKHSIVNLTAFVDKVTEAVQQQAASAQQINSSIDELGTMSGELKKQANNLIG